MDFDTSTRETQPTIAERVSRMSEIEDEDDKIEPAIKFNFDPSDPVFQIDKREMNEFQLPPGEDPDKLRETARGLVTALDQGGVLLGWTLYLIYYNHLYKKWGYETFNDYVFNELGNTESAAKRRINLARKFCKDLAIDSDKLAGIGYTRAAMISPVIKVANANEWLEKARSSSLKELRQAIEAEKLTNPKLKARKLTEPLKELPNPLDVTEDHPTITVDGNATDISPANPNSIVPLKPSEVDASVGDSPIKRTFFLFEGQLRLLDTALEVMERNTGSPKEGENLSKILQTFLAHANVDDKYNSDTPLLEMRSFEVNHGGKLVWLKTEVAAKKIREILENETDINGEMTS